MQVGQRRDESTKLLDLKAKKQEYKTWSGEIMFSILWLIIGDEGDKISKKHGEARMRFIN